MLFPYNELGDAITKQHLQDIKDDNRSKRTQYYQRRYSMLKGIATDPCEPEYDRELCKTFFPQGTDESNPEYDERMKVWIPQGANLLNRLTDLALKGNVEYKFKAVDSENAADIELAAFATEVYEASLDYNNWELIGRERIFEANGIGQISDWLDYRRHDPRTGEEFDKGGRVRFIKYWPWFAEPVVSPDNVTEIIGAVLIYNEEGQSITNAVSLTMDLTGQRKLVTKLWLDPLFNTENGKPIHKGAYVVFENETSALPEGKEDWANDNKYGLTPVVFWQSVDIDESQYNGESYLDRFIDPLLKLCRVASSELSGIQYIINQLVLYAAKETTPDKITVRHNRTHKFAQGEPSPEMRILERMLDLKPEQETRAYLAAVIGEAGGFSPELSSLDGIGKIGESGIALKIAYEKTVDAVKTIRRNYAKSKTELMEKVLKVILVENDGKIGGKKIDMTKIRAAVGFDDNIMPVSELDALELNVRRRDEGIITEEQFIILENAEVKTSAQAETHMQKIREARAKNKPEQPEPPQRNGLIRRIPKEAQQPK